MKKPFLPLFFLKGLKDRWLLPIKRKIVHFASIALTDWQPIVRLKENYFLVNAKPSYAKLSFMYGHLSFLCTKKGRCLCGTPLIIPTFLSSFPKSLPQQQWKKERPVAKITVEKKHIHHKRIVQPKHLYTNNRIVGFLPTCGALSPCLLNTTPFPHFLLTFLFL